VFGSYVFRWWLLALGDGGLVVLGAFVKRVWLWRCWLDLAMPVCG
jgi:hypothetical protein